jgi:hypothetical protein
MKNFKLQVIRWISGKLGPLITPLISGLVGTLVGTLYSWIGDILEKSPSLKLFFEGMWNNLDLATQSALHPMSVGAIVAGGVYILIQEMLNRYFLGEIKEDQKQLNKVLPPQERLTIDGFKGPKTKAAQAKVLDMVKK